MWASALETIGGGLTAETIGVTAGVAVGVLTLRAGLEVLDGR
jgi:hypothetical protein